MTDSTTVCFFQAGNAAVTVNNVPCLRCISCGKEEYTQEAAAMLTNIYSVLITRQELPEFINMDIYQDPMTV